MRYQSEAQLESLLIQQLEKQEFKTTRITDYNELVHNFKHQFFLFNKEKLQSKPLTSKEWERVFNEIDGKSVFVSAKKLRDKFVLVREDDTEVYLQLFDDRDVDRNIYQVTSQTTVVGVYHNRYDVTLLINGLPVVQIELKRRGMDIKEAFNQVQRYRKHSYTGLYSYIQVFIISNGVDTKYFANSNLNKEMLFSQTFYWTDEVNSRITNLQDFCDVFLRRRHLVKMIGRYTVLNDTDNVLMVMRPYQVFATEALVRRALETNKNAYLWHTTGSGKTLTSFKVAQLLAAEQDIKKVFFVVDRKDLDTQTTTEFNKFQSDSVDTTENTNVLIGQIKDRNRRLIVTTIQKMAKAIATHRYADTMNIYKDDKVVFIIDECHRSQFGEMHKAIIQHFKKGVFFGFTGTPRFIENKSQDGRTTADIFEKCVHSYLIKEAIHDNNVLGFHVDYIKTFKGQYDENDDTKVSGIDTEEVFMSEERIALVANHIVQYHNAKTRNKEYTALFATASIPMLIKYYDEFKKINHDLKIAAVYSYGTNEDAEGREEHSRDSLERIIADYNKMFGTNYSTETYTAYNTDISKKVKTKQIDILIVVNMYLTGFDSKPLNTLYVDKNLKFHDLLQAYSRTNRIERSTKPFGNIVCYRNLKERTDEAIKLFSQTDSVDDVLLRDYDFYLDKFNDVVESLLEIAPSPASIDSMQSEDDQRTFIHCFKDLSKLLLTLQTFVEFSFDKEKLSMDEQTYQDYKSKYLLLYETAKRNGGQKVSILNDIDFEIELMESNKINVAYIMNLIRNLDLENKDKKLKGIKHILDELERADNPALKKKVDLIKAFLNEIAVNLYPNSDIDDAYQDFENKERERELIEFAQKEELDYDYLLKEVSEYEFSGILSKDKIRDGITKPMPLLKKTGLVNRIMVFIVEHVDKYQ